MLSDCSSCQHNPGYPSAKCRMNRQYNMVWWHLSTKHDKSTRTTLIAPIVEECSSFTEPTGEQSIDDIPF
jgi:hypothetical protein